MVRRKKNNQTNMTGVAKGFVTILLCGFFLYGLYRGLGTFFYSSSVFRIDEVVKIPSLQFIQSRSLDRLLGQNIFRADLKDTERRLKTEYPQLDRLRIVRMLPNRIAVIAEKREPFAVIVLKNQDILVDDTGVIITMNASGNESVPQVIGVNDVSVLRQDRPLSSQKISVGFSVIAALGANDSLRKFKLHWVDVTNLSQIRLQMNGMEVVLDHSGIDQKIQTLALLLSDTGIALEQINYLDLRFREPIIRKK